MAARARRSSGSRRSGIRRKRSNDTPVLRFVGLATSSSSCSDQSRQLDEIVSGRRAAWAVPIRRSPCPSRTALRRACVSAGLSRSRHGGSCGLREFAIQRGKHLVDNPTDQPQRMVLRNTLLDVHIGKQFARPLIRTAHETNRNHIRWTLSPSTAALFSGLLSYSLSRTQTQDLVSGFAERQGARPGRGRRGGKNPLQLVDPAEMGAADQEFSMRCCRFSICAGCRPATSRRRLPLSWARTRATCRRR